MGLSLFAFLPPLAALLAGVAAVSVPIVIHLLSRRRYVPAESVDQMADGRLRVVLAEVLPLGRVNDAFTALVDRAVTGKIVLDLGR